MTYAQKMLDERRLGYIEGRQEGMEKGLKQGMENGLKQGMENGLRQAVAALKGVLPPVIIAERFHMSLEQVEDILNQE